MKGHKVGGKLATLETVRLYNLKKKKKRKKGEGASRRHGDQTSRDLKRII